MEKWMDEINLMEGMNEWINAFMYGEVKEWDEWRNGWMDEGGRKKWVTK